MKIDIPLGTVLRVGNKMISVYENPKFGYAIAECGKCIFNGTEICKHIACEAEIMDYKQKI